MMNAFHLGSCSDHTVQQSWLLCASDLDEKPPMGGGSQIHLAARTAEISKETKVANNEASNTIVHTNRTHDNEKT